MTSMISGHSGMYCTEILIIIYVPFERGQSHWTILIKIEWHIIIIRRETKQSEVMQKNILFPFLSFLSLPLDLYKLALLGKLSPLS